MFCEAEQIFSVRAKSLRIIIKRTNLRMMVGLFLAALSINPLLVPQPTSAATGINQQINFQGKVVNPNGTNIPNGTYNIEFKIYQDGDGVLGTADETLKWTETRLRNNSQGVTITDGIFQVNLGSVNNTLGSAVDFNQDTLWLSINLGNTNATCTPFSSCSPDGQMDPFIRFTSAPYAQNAGMLNGLTSSQFVQLAQGVQVDASTASSIFINKTGATGNILQFQDAGTDAFVIGNSGTTAINTNSTTALVVQNGNNAFGVDTTNVKVAIGLATSSATTRLSIAGQTAANGITLGDGAAGSANLYVSANDTLKTDDSLIVGTIGTGGTNLLCYDGSNKLAACSSAPGSGNYIYNGTGLQTNANFNIQSAAAGSIGGIIRGATSQTADLLEFQDSAGALLSRIASDGSMYINRANNAIGTNSFVSGNNQTLSVLPTASNRSALFVKGVASQAADLIQVQNSSATVLARFDANGRLGLGGVPFAQLQVQNEAALTGAGTISSSGTTVTGSGTSFTTQLSVGDFIIASGQSRRITAIASDTSLTTATGFSPVISGGTSFTYEHPGIRSLSAASQVADVFQLQSSTGSSLVRIDSTGRIFSAAEINAFDGTAVLSNNRLQVNGGTFYLSGGSSSGQAVAQGQGNFATTFIVKGGFGGFQGTTDLFQLQSDASTILAAFSHDGKLVFGPSGSQDTNLYRDSAGNILKTDDSFTVGGNFLQSGSGTFDTGTGIVSLNGPTNIASTVSLATKKGADYTTPGSADDVAISTASLYVLDTSAAAQIITGIVAGRDGQQLTLVNADTALGVTLNNQDTNSSANNRIITGTGSNVTIPYGGSISLVYDAATSRWRVVGNVAAPSSGAGAVILQGGNSFGANVAIGANDGFGIDFRTNNGVKASLTTAGDLLFGQASSITTSVGALTIDSLATTTLVVGNTAAGVSLCNSSACDAITIGTNSDADTIQVGDANDTLTLTGTTELVGTTSVNNNANFNTVINTGTSTGMVTIGNSLSTGITLENGTGTGANAANLFNADTNHTINIGAGGTSTIQAITLGSTSSSSSTTLQAGSGNLNFNASQAQFTEVTGTRTLTVQTRTTNVAGSNFTIAGGAAGSGANALTGGTLALQGGAAGGTGNANGGNVVLQGGAGVGTGVMGLVSLAPTVFSAATTQSFGANGTITQANIDGFSTIVLSSSVVGPVTVTVPSPTNSSIGRILYVTVTGSNSIIITTPGGSPNFTLAPNTSATFIWNGTDWTNAGVDGGSNSYIQNQTSADQTANFRISGTGRANTSFTTPLVDALSGGILEIGKSVASTVSVGNLTAGNSATTNLQAGTGGIFLQTANSTASNNTGAISIKTGNVATGSNNTSGSITIASGDASGGNASSGSVSIDSGTKTGSGTAGAITIGTTNANVLTIGNTTGATATTLQAGTGNLNFNASQAQFSEVTGTRTLTVQTRTTNIAGSSLTVSGGTAGSGGSAFTGGTLTLQGGNAGGTGNASGANVVMRGGTGVGTGVSGIVEIDTPVFTASATQAFGSNGTIAQAVVDTNSTIPINATAASLTITLPAPTNTTVGRIIYVTSITGSNSFTIAPAGGTNFVMNANMSGTFIWNGAGWTNAGVDGGSSSYIQNQNSVDQTANFRVSGTGRANTSFISPLVDGISAALGGAASLGVGTNSTGTTALSIGNTSASFTLESSATANLFTGATAHTIAIGTSASGDNDISVGSTNAGSTLTLESGTGANAIQIGNGNTVHDIKIGAGGTSAAQTIAIGSAGSAASTVTITAGATNGINLNAPIIATTATTLGLFNTNAATVTALQAGTSISVGATTGTLTVRNANQTFGNAAGSGVFTNNGATLNSTLALTDFATGGSIGSAASTVDIYTSISVLQTTTLQTLTIPTPTSNPTTVFGRVLYLSNVGTASFTLGPTTVNPGTTATLIWSNTDGAATGGESWQFAGADGNGILNQNSANQTANFRISGTGRANTSFISPLVDGISAALGGAASLGVGTSSAGTTALSIGNTSASFALESSATANLFTGATAHTIAIGTSSSGDNDISVGSTNAGSTFTLEAGTGSNAIQIGNGSTNHEIRIGSNASGVQAVSLGSTSSTSNTTISGGTGTATGDLVLQTAASGIINIGTNNVATKVINIGSVAAVAQNTTVQIASSSAGVQAVTIGSLSSTSTLNLQGGTGTAAGDINIGDSTLAAKIIDIGSVSNAGTSTIRIATAAAAQTVTVGSTDTTSTTTIQAGTGGINLVGSGGSNTGIKVTTSANSTAAFQIQSASAADTLLRADTSGNVVKIGNDTGTTTATTQFVLDNATTAPTADGAGINGSMYYDSTLGRIQCYESGVWGRCSSLNQNVTLVPEYPGAVLTGDGGSNVGTMTSDFCSDFQNIADGGGTAACDTNQEHNYYSWTTTQGSTQDYDIFVRYQLPSDFGGFVSSSSIQMYGWRTDNGAGNVIDVSMYEGSTQCGTTTNVATAAATDWSLVALSGDETGCSGLAAGDTVLFRLHLSAENTEFVRAGEIVFDYKSK